MLKTLKQAASQRAEGLLNAAVDYLKQARDADPSYLPARLNFAVAYLYLGQPQQASAWGVAGADRRSATLRDRRLLQQPILDQRRRAARGSVWGSLQPHGFR
ncbi:MAG: tetratricopeptide repeat protein [Gammaproteobacteria bacterium]